MKRRVSCVLVMSLIFATLAASAAGSIALKEIRWSADLAPNPKTGEPAVYFSVVLQYDPLPTRVDLSVSWVVYALVDGRKCPPARRPRPQHRMHRSGSSTSCRLPCLSSRGRRTARTSWFGTQRTT